METLKRRGFAVQRVGDMDGWLAYHAVFVVCVAAALERCGTDPVQLSRDNPTLRLMCRAVGEGFDVLRSRGAAAAPRNLRVLHLRWLTPLAVRYWARTMRSPMGELCFAAHTRHAHAEMHALGAEVIARIGTTTQAPALRQLLTTARS